MFIYLDINDLLDSDPEEEDDSSGGIKNPQQSTDDNAQVTNSACNSEEKEVSVKKECDGGDTSEDVGISRVDGGQAALDAEDFALQRVKKEPRIE